MGKILSLVTGNPMLLIWGALAVFAFGLATGGGAAWKIQGWRLDAAKNEHKAFVAEVKGIGEAAEAQARQKEAENTLKKEKADHENARTIANLNVSIKRLRDDRTVKGFLPPAPAGASRPERICFDRVKLDGALRGFDDEAAGIVANGDFARVNLDTAKVWAKGLNPE